MAPFTLPPAVAGLEYSLAVQDADGLLINPAVGDTINIGADIFAGIQSTVPGSVIRLKAVNTTEWYAISALGDWDVSTSPASLYAPTARGDFWEAADLNRLFQDNIATIPIVASEAPVGAMLGQRGVHNFTQTSAAARPLYRSGGATGNLGYDDSNDILSVASSQSLFKYLHDGTGGSMWVIATVLDNSEHKHFLGTKGSSSNFTGTLLQRHSATSRFIAYIGTGTAQTTLTSSLLWPLGSPVMGLLTYSTVDGMRLYINGVAAGAQAGPAAPSSGNSNSTLNLTPSLTAAAPEIRAAGVIDRVLTPAEVLSLYQYYFARGTFNSVVPDTYWNARYFPVRYFPQRYFP